MGAPKAPTVVHYDASVKQAEAASKGLDLMSRAQGQAYTSSRMSTLLGQEAVNRVREGVGLLGEYLKDRNLSITNQIPLDEDYLRQVTAAGTNASQAASDLFSKQASGSTAAQVTPQAVLGSSYGDNRIQGILSSMGGK